MELNDKILALQVSLSEITSELFEKEHKLKDEYYQKRKIEEKQKSEKTHEKCLSIINDKFTSVRRANYRSKETQHELSFSEFSLIVDYLKNRYKVFKVEVNINGVLITIPKYDVKNYR